MSILASWAIRRDLEDIIEKREVASFYRQSDTMEVSEVLQSGKKIYEEKQRKINGLKAVIRSKVPDAISVDVVENIFEEGYFVRILTKDEKSIEFTCYKDGVVENDTASDELKALVGQLANCYFEKKLYDLNIETISRNYILRIKNSGLEIRLCNRIFDYLNKELKLTIPFNREPIKRPIKTKHGNASLKTNMSGIRGMFTKKQNEGNGLESFINNLKVYEDEVPEDILSTAKSLRKK